jgi:hypothetical protein
MSGTDYSVHSFFVLPESAACTILLAMISLAAFGGYYKFMWEQIEQRQIPKKLSSFHPTSIVSPFKLVA